MGKWVKWKDNILLLNIIYYYINIINGDGDYVKG